MGLIFRFLGYVMFGIAIEVVFVAIAKIVDGKITNRDKYLKGHTYLWMTPIYGLLLILIFEPVYVLIKDFNIVFRFIIWAIAFTSTEAIFGWAYDKILGFCPWDYSKSKWKVFKNGYTKYNLIPAWGIAGLLVELYSQLLIAFTPYVYDIVNKFIGNFI